MHNGGVQLEQASGYVFTDPAGRSSSKMHVMQRGQLLLPRLPETVRGLRA